MAGAPCVERTTEDSSGHPSYCYSIHILFFFFFCIVLIFFFISPLILIFNLLFPFLKNILFLNKLYFLFLQYSIVTLHSLHVFYFVFLLV